MPTHLATFLSLIGRGWKLIASRRMQVIALLVVMALLIPTPAHAQIGFITGLIGIISSGLRKCKKITFTTDKCCVEGLYSSIHRGICVASDGYGRTLQP